MNDFKFNIWSNKNKQYTDLLNGDILEKEELISLLSQMNDGNPQDRIKARNKLVEKYLKIVPKIARKFSNSEDDFNELLSEGNFVLVKSIERITPDKHYSMLSYLKKSVNNKFINIKRDESRKIKLSFIDGIENQEEKEYYVFTNSIDEIKYDSIKNPFNELKLKDFKKEIDELIRKKFIEKNCNIFWDVIESGDSLAVVGERFDLTKPRIHQIYKEIIKFIQTEILKEKKY